MKENNENDLISRRALYDTCVKLEQEALKMVQTADDRIEKLIWNAVLTERSAFKFSVVDAPASLSNPSTKPEHKAPISCKEQLSLDCSFCRQHEYGDTLYESADWDGGIGFDYIRNIRFCPICGRELYGYEDEEKRKNE